MCVCATNRIRDVVDAAETATQKPASESAVGRGGPANPFTRRMAELRWIMVESVSNEQMRRVTAKLYDMALAGNMQAMRLFYDNVVGKPTLAVNPDHVQIDEWKCFAQSAQMSTELGTVMKSLEPEIPLEMARNVRPILSEMMRTEFVDALMTEDVPAIGTGETPVLRRGSPSTNGGIGGRRRRRSRRAGRAGSHCCGNAK